MISELSSDTWVLWGVGPLTKGGGSNSWFGTMLYYYISVVGISIHTDKESNMLFIVLDIFFSFIVVLLLLLAITSVYHTRNPPYIFVANIFLDLLHTMCLYRSVIMQMGFAWLFRILLLMCLCEQHF